MEAYLDGNIIKFKPIKKKLTYDDIAKELFHNKYTYYPYSSPNRDTDIQHTNIGNIDFVSFPLNCVSKKQVDKLFAIGKLMNVAKRLNGDWQPDWNNKQENKYALVLTNNNREIINPDYQTVNRCFVYFKTSKLAEQAIEILGEETIKLALCTDW